MWDVHTSIPNRSLTCAACACSLPQAQLAACSHDLSEVRQQLAALQQEHSRALLEADAKLKEQAAGLQQERLQEVSDLKAAHDKWVCSVQQGLTARGLGFSSANAAPFLARGWTSQAPLLLFGLAVEPSSALRARGFADQGVCHTSRPRL